MFDWIRNLFNSVWSSKPVVPESTETDSVPTTIKQESVVQSSSTIDKHEPRKELIEYGLENEAVNLTMHDAEPEVKVTPVLCGTPTVAELKQVAQGSELDIKHDLICAITPELNEAKTYTVETSGSKQLEKLAAELVGDIIDMESKNKEYGDEKATSEAHSNDDKKEQDEDEKVEQEVEEEEKEQQEEDDGGYGDFGNEDDDEEEEEEDEEEEEEEKEEKEKNDEKETKEHQKQEALEPVTKPEQIEKCRAQEDIDLSSHIAGGEIGSTQPFTYMQTPTAPPLETDKTNQSTTPMPDIHDITSKLMEREPVKPDALSSEIDHIES